MKSKLRSYLFVHNEAKVMFVIVYKRDVVLLCNLTIIHASSN